MWAVGKGVNCGARHSHTHRINVLCIANLFAAGSDPVEILPNYARKLCVKIPADKLALRILRIRHVFGILKWGTCRAIEGTTIDRDMHCH